jgi:hypothetical protein
MPKVEITWHRKNEEGVRLEINARRAGSQWQFYERERRFDQWQRVSQPPLEDWLALLDGVERRIQRRLLRPESAAQLRKLILEQYPEANFDES